MASETGKRKRPIKHGIAFAFELANGVADTNRICTQYSDSMLAEIFLQLCDRSDIHTMHRRTTRSVNHISLCYMFRGLPHAYIYIATYIFICGSLGKVPRWGKTKEPPIVCCGTA